MHRECRDGISNAMTVRQLIEELELCDPDFNVLFVCNYGDFGNTQQALPVVMARDIDPCERIVDSGYSQSQMALAGSGGNPDEEEAWEIEEQGVAILSLEHM